MLFTLQPVARASLAYGSLHDVAARQSAAAK